MTENQPSSPGPEGEGSNVPDVERVAQFCEKLVHCLRMEVNVKASFEDGATCINLTGPDRPLLLSNAAALLNSMEYLVNRVFRTGRDEEFSSILLDSDRYRQHREAELVLLAQMAAQKVLAQRRPLSLQPMTPRERRIVHLALASIEGVRSESRGEGDNRSITIHLS